MAHAQKPGFFFQRNGRVHLNRRGGGRASVQSTADSRGVRISGSNAGYTMFRSSMKSTVYPLHSPVSPFTSPSCVTVFHHIAAGVQLILSAIKVLARHLNHYKLTLAQSTGFVLNSAGILELHMAFSYGQPLKMSEWMLEKTHHYSENTFQNERQNLNCKPCSVFGRIFGGLQKYKLTDTKRVLCTWSFTQIYTLRAK